MLELKNITYKVKEDNQEKIILDDISCVFDDDMIIALHKNGGIMGMNYCAAFLNDNEEEGRNTIKCVIEHMKYIKSLVNRK